MLEHFTLLWGPAQWPFGSVNCGCELKDTRTLLDDFETGDFVGHDSEFPQHVLHLGVTSPKTNMEYPIKTYGGIF